jgi:hypothetical protein
MAVVRRLLFGYDRRHSPFPICAALPNFPAGIYCEISRAKRLLLVIFRETGNDFWFINYVCILIVCVYESLNAVQNV